MLQPTAKVTAEDIKRLITRDFGSADLEIARDVISEYGSGERLRVMAGALKLADGDLDKLKYYIKQANSDYRDILMWAEYRTYARVTSAHSLEAPPELMQLASNADAQDYGYWFRRLASDPKVSPSSKFRDASNDDPRWAEAIEAMETRIQNYKSYPFILSTNSKNWPEHFEVMIETTFFPALAEFAVEASFVFATLKIGPRDNPREIRRYRWSKDTGVARID